MPGIGGRELFRSIKLERPELKTLFMSGYDEAIVNGERFEQGTAFLSKPASGDMLLQKIRDLL